MKQEDNDIKNSKSCPVSFKLIDGTVSRIGAYFVILFILAYLFTSQILFLSILVLDFLIRIYTNKAYSIIFQLSRFVKKRLKLETKMTDGGAKSLAIQFGLLLSILLLFEVLFNFQLAFYITVAIFLVCTTLEAFFNYCVGCEIFYILKRWDLL